MVRPYHVSKTLKSFDTVQITLTANLSCPSLRLHKCSLRSPGSMSSRRSMRYTVVPRVEPSASSELPCMPRPADSLSLDQDLSHCKWVLSWWLLLIKSLERFSRQSLLVPIECLSIRIHPHNDACITARIWQCCCIQTCLSWLARVSLQICDIYCLQSFNGTSFIPRTISPAGQNMSHLLCGLLSPYDHHLGLWSSNNRPHQYNL